MGLQPYWITPEGLFAVLIDGQERYCNSTRSALNSQVSVSLAINKYLTRRILERHGLRNIPFLRPPTLEAAELFLSEHGRIIAKPLKGSGAQDIHVITDPSQFTALQITDYILEKYIVGQEIRYLILNGVVIAVHRSEYGESVAADRALQRISYPRAQWDEGMEASAIRAAKLLGLNFVAVDYLLDAHNVAHILEINSAPGLSWFHAPTAGPAVDVARQFLEAVFDDRSKKDTRISNISEVMA